MRRLHLCCVILVLANGCQPDPVGPVGGNGQLRKINIPGTQARYEAWISSDTLELGRSFALQSTFWNTGPDTLLVSSGCQIPLIHGLTFDTTPNRICGGGEYYMPPGDSMSIRWVTLPVTGPVGFLTIRMSHYESPAGWAEFSVVVRE